MASGTTCVWPTPRAMCLESSSTAYPRSFQTSSVKPQYWNNSPSYPTRDKPNSSLDGFPGCMALLPPPWSEQLKIMQRQTLRYVGSTRRLTRSLNEDKRAYREAASRRAIKRWKCAVRFGAITSATPKLSVQKLQCPLCPNWLRGSWLIGEHAAIPPAVPFS